ncbi:hypothetical protein HQ571_02455 [Candidatus Kuenenbacteria bacterium]|nr:hypothetical protein [Candidatus Kuenenbacteria bacterium]
MKNKKLLPSLFYSMLGIFIFLVLYFVTPFTREVMQNIFWVIAILGGVFFIMGILLIVFTVKQKIKGKQKVFLILTGASAVGVLVFSILHNLVYGLLIFLFNENIWDKLGGEEPFFFILAILVCPVVFLVGVVGSIVGFVRK